MNAYAHPSMLEDPWADLERQRGRRPLDRSGNRDGTSNQGDDAASESRISEPEFAQKALSESMIPQVRNRSFLKVFRKGKILDFFFFRLVTAS